MNHKELRIEIWTRLEEKIKMDYNEFDDLIKSGEDYDRVADMVKQFKVIWNGYDYDKVEKEEFANAKESAP